MRLHKHAPDTRQNPEPQLLEGAVAMLTNMF